MELIDIVCQPRGSYQPFRVNSKINYKVGNWHCNCACAYIPCTGDGYGLTWLPHSRYLRAFWILIWTCFSFLPLVAALESTPTRYSKVRATAEGEGQSLRWELWNIGISSRPPSLQLLLSKCLRRGWRKFGQESVPISPITLLPPTARHSITVPISICYPTPCFIYVVSSGPLWPTFYHYKS